MQNSETPVTRSFVTGSVALITLVVMAVLFSEARSASTYESSSGNPMAQTRPQAEVSVEPAGVSEETPVQETERVATAQETATAEHRETVEESQDTAQAKPIVIPAPSPYETPPISFDSVNQMTMPALVNILCGSTPGSNITGATGSGVLIDPRGVILTNAHVAQYFLLQNLPQKPVSCVIRTGSPAQTRYIADVLAFPQAWALTYGKDLLAEEATGTGEHDWALLYITGRTDGSEKPSVFPFVTFDPRRAVATAGDPVLIASYPAGFLGGVLIQKNLWPVSTIVTIQKVYTFTQAVVDILALGGTIVAQSGSSGGAVVNQWGKLVGIIVTSSSGATTAERDLRAVTLSHVDASVKAHTGNNLSSFLQLGDFETRVAAFKENSLPHLLESFPI